MIDHNDSSVVLEEEESKSYQIKNSRKVESIQVQNRLFKVGNTTTAKNYRYDSIKSDKNEIMRPRKHLKIDLS